MRPPLLGLPKSIYLCCGQVSLVSVAAKTPFFFCFCFCLVVVVVLFFG